MSYRGRILLLLLILIAAALRINGLFANTFHDDEALFASWSRLIALFDDPLLKSQLVDKPPLLFYLQALFYPLFGPVMWAARLPNLVASILLIPLTSILAWRLYRDESTVILAAAFVVFSPMAIQFSASGFIDPLMTCLIVASLIFVVRRPAGLGESQSRGGVKEWRQPFVSGVLFGLAAASKYQAWLFIPLLIGLAKASRWRKTEWTRWLAGLMPLIILLLAWEVAREGRFTLVESQIRSFGGFRLTWSWELWPRLVAWGSQWSYVLASPVLEFLLLLAVPLFIAVLIDQQDWAAAIDRLLVVYVLAYFLFHWFVAIPAWDRYVLPVLPLVGLVLARFVWRVVSFVWPLLSDALDLRLDKNQLLLPLLLILVAFQASSVVDAASGNLPIGASPTADKGAAEIGEALSEAPYGTVLYDHWYSWQWRYHLFDKRVYVSWFQHPDALVEDLQVFGINGGSRYVVLPNSAAALPVLRALKSTEFTLEPVIAAGEEGDMQGMILYRIRPRPR